jgi:hypothetical protein
MMKHLRQVGRWTSVRRRNLARAAIPLLVLAIVFASSGSLTVAPPARQQPTTLQLLLEHEALLTMGRLLLLLAGAYVAYSLLSLTWRGRPIKQAGPLGADEQPVRDLAESRDRAAQVAEEATATVPELLESISTRDALIIELRRELAMARSGAAAPQEGPQAP